MRATIAMKPEHRARILELAANRGEKGFSAVVAEALEFCLENQDGRESSIWKALALKGSVTEAEAAALASHARKIRENGDDNSRYGRSHRLARGGRRG